jgi:uncharacterized membrane protein YkoI
MDKQRSRLIRVVAAGAVAIGLAAGSYGVASAAGSSGSDSTSGLGAGTSSGQSAQPWGGQRSDETLLTGETKSRVEAAATAKLSGAAVVRVETDAAGNAAYEVHMVKPDGTTVTVYVDEQFDVVSVQDAMPAPPHQQPQA